MMKSLACIAASSLALAAAAPLTAQEAIDIDPAPPPEEETVFDGDYLTLGVGAIYGPSYDGSDDYVLSPIPVVQASLGGVDINPRPGGLALDFIPDGGGGPDLSLGVAARLVRNRASQIKDPVVEALGELDTAIEVGPTAGISFPAVLNPYDSLSFNTDARWDVAGAHQGMVVTPSITYFTPLSRAVAASLSVGTTRVSGDYADYYYSVTPAQSLASGLPVFDADSGFKDVGVNLFLGIDLDGDATNGGLALIGVAGYSHMLGDFADSPFTSIRGDADQFMVGGGVGYTF